MFEDLRYSLRALARSPSFTLVAVVGLALGIGANSAIFTAMNAVLLRPLPYKEAEQLVLLWQLNRHNGDHEIKASAPDYIDWKEQNSVFQDIAAFNANSGLGLNLSGAFGIDGAGQVTPNEFLRRRLRVTSFQFWASRQPWAGHSSRMRSAQAPLRFAFSAMVFGSGDSAPIRKSSGRQSR